MPKKIFKSLLFPLLCIALLVPAVGCGQTAAGREITVVDGMCRTLVSVYGGETVADVLAAAEISLDEEDTVSPDSDDVLDDATDTIIVSRHAEVTVTEGETVTSVSLTGATVSDAIETAGISLNKHDVTNHSLSAYLTDGMEISVEHWYEVTLTVAGTEQTIVTDAATVGDLLDEQNIVVDEDDRLSPDAGEPLSEGLVITVEYVSSAEIRETEEIAYTTIEQETDELYIGETKVAQEGQNGIRTYVYEVTYVEGAEESRRLVNSYISTPAVDEIILIGTKEEETEPETTTTEPETTAKPETPTTAQSEAQTTAKSETPTTTKSETQTTTEAETERKTDANGDPVSETIPDGVIYYQFNYDCDGSMNGWFTFYFEDGHVEYQDYWAP